MTTVVRVPRCLWVWIAIISLAAISAPIPIVVAADASTGKPWLDMDYGPFLTTTVTVPEPAGNVTNKAIVVRVGRDRRATVVFDTDLLRWSAGWTDGFLNLRGTVFDGVHGPHPTMSGDLVFANRAGPGWARQGGFDDPRPLPHGPLPATWGRYNGLYLYEGNVVLAYTVGGAKVLDLPGADTHVNRTAITRTLHIGKSKNDLLLHVCEQQRGAVELVALGTRKPVGGDNDKLKVAEVLAVVGGPRLNKLIAGETSGEPKRPALPASLQQGLAAHWTFDEKPTKAVKSAAGKKHAGAIEGATWAEHGKAGGAMTFSGKDQVTIAESAELDFATSDFSIAAWVKTRTDGTIAAKAPIKGQWARQGKALFIRDGRLHYDIGWVGVVGAQRTITDGHWHHVALVSTHGDERVKLYVDGTLDGEGKLASPDDAAYVVKLGYTSANFPQRHGLIGSLDDVRIYQRALTGKELAALGYNAVSADAVTVVGCTGAPNGVAWVVRDKSRLLLRIPSFATPATIKLVYQRGRWKAVAAMADAVKNAPPPTDPESLTHGGPPRWNKTVATQGKRGQDSGAFTVDTLAVPYDNPWHAWMRFGGVDFFSDGRAAICTWSGDVWIVSGIDDDLDLLTWRRVATGLFQPLGLKVVDDTIYVLGRDQLTRLHDLNDDGEADYYENFNNDMMVTEHFHEFALDLHTDKAGNFYFAKAGRHAMKAAVPHHGTILRVSKDGGKLDIIANGWRAPNGMCISPDGRLTISDNEGHWVPASKINWVRRGAFHGYMWTYHTGPLPTTYHPPLCWIPKVADNSGASQVWVTSDGEPHSQRNANGDPKWGPFKGKLLFLSYGKASLFHVLYEEIGPDLAQGGVVRFPLTFNTGIMRARFNPKDGELYVCGLKGWQTNGPLDGGFQRVRYTGKPAHMPLAMHVTPTGVALTFTDPLDKETAADPDSYQVQRWNYRWTKTYGSKHYRVSNPDEVGEDDVKVTAATVSPDGRTVTLTFADHRPSMQLQVRYNLETPKGEPVRSDVYATVHVVPKP